ncbi:MAG: twin-arginine translocase TatA/TatE family subunit [Deltaproteobacteria bacterium]|nr:twin-arginine translocase TatA/TatE family subunit [Deltaproteobacteria bacterium]
MFGLGTGELLVVLALALIFIGPEKIPSIATQLGRAIRKFRQSIDEIKSDLKDV